MKCLVCAMSCLLFFGSRDVHAQEEASPGKVLQTPWQGAKTMVGGSLGVGPVLVTRRGAKADLDVTLLGAARVGLLLGHLEFTAELAPLTWLPSLGYEKTVMSVSGTIGGIIPITERLFWPMRLRFGMSLINTPNDDIMTILGGDLIGLGYRLDSGWLFEVAAPSYRYAGDFDRYSNFAWPISFTVSRIL